MRLSRGWYGLILFWTGVVSLCAVGAGTLQVLGSPHPEERSAQLSAADPVTIEFALRVPPTSFAVATAVDGAVKAPDQPDDASVPNAHEAPPEPVQMAGSE